MFFILTAFCEMSVRNALHIAKSFVGDSCLRFAEMEGAVVKSQTALLCSDRLLSVTPLGDSSICFPVTRTRPAWALCEGLAMSELFVGIKEEA